MPPTTTPPTTRHTTPPSPVLAAEVDGFDETVEVRILWGSHTPIDVRHLSPPRPFIVGEDSAERDAQRPDFIVDRRALGRAHMPVLEPFGGGIAAVVTRGAEGIVRFDGGEQVTLADPHVQQRLQPHPQHADLWLLPLPEGAESHVRLGGLTFVVRPGRAARRIGAPSPRIDWEAQRWSLASLSFFGLMLTLFHLLPPSAAAISMQEVNRENRYVQMMLTPDELTEPDPPKQAHKGVDGGKSGKAAKDPTGEMGEPDKPNKRRKYSVKGPADNPDPSLLPEPTETMAAQAGIIGVLTAMQVSDGPTSPYAAQNAQGRDAASMLGNLFGDQLGASGGRGGLGAIGTGRGGGGHAAGTVGMGRIGTLGSGTGDRGFGRAAGKLGVRGARVPPAHSGAVSVRGSLSKEAIRRTIRRHVNEVRYCYEQGLTRRPDLQGRVAVRFAIGQDGVVKLAAVAKSSVTDSRVTDCITRAVKRWDFPQPEGGGLVMVTYPFVLRQAD